MKKIACNFFGLNFNIDIINMGFNINYINSNICIKQNYAFG